MNLRQQIVATEVERLQAALSSDPDHAFLRFAHSLVTGQSVSAFEPDDLVEGGQDKQLDVITIHEDGESADIYILQTTFTESFSSNALIQLANGLRWLFERPRTDLATLTNQALRDKIIQYRSVQSSLGPSNIRIHVAFATNGPPDHISPEFRQELRGIQTAYSSGIFETFDIRPVGCDDLVALLRAQDRQSKRIDAEMRIKYDANNPSLIRYYAQDFKGLVCTVPATEIARLVNADSEGAIFDLNIRRYLGAHGAVNSDILDTCSSPESSYEFWFLNNGLTIVCDSFDAATDPDNPHIKLKNMQIVNGCQTAATLAIAAKEGTLAPDVRVMARVYETADRGLVERIVLTTNNQNRISSRDLRDNGAVQQDLERAFANHGYLYERKARQYDEATVDATKIVANELAAQFYLAVVMRNPADARGRKYKIWSEHYTRIFSGAVSELYLIAFLLGRAVSTYIRTNRLRADPDDVRRVIAKRGTFHLARIAARLWRGGDDWTVGTDVLLRQLSELTAGAPAVQQAVGRAFALLEETIRASPDFLADIDRALKSYQLDVEIERRLAAL